MSSVTVSPKFQIVIPKDIRKALQVKPGMKISMFSYGSHVVLMPVPKLEDLRGMCKGMDTTLDRTDFDRDL
jgi:AbrB family looped-hinge helix DNA binding protein